ncbi:MAG: P-type conjugative transfer protein VirB9 [Planctomycetes bacterium]|nr:P-type conjugative transfer protein VirB9 [Planctomycetota bacterium]
MKKLILIVWFAWSAQVLAEQPPLGFPSDGRIKRVAFQENQVVPLNGVTFTSTQIMFSPSEQIMDVEGGDSAGWMVTLHPHLKNMLFVKPTVLDSNANMTVITNRHVYYFHVKSNASLTTNPKNQTYAIKFIYPEDERLRLKMKLKAKQAQVNQAKSPLKYNWNYRFSGSKSILPSHVFDDGTFTYFELRQNQAVPAIFAVDDKSGREAVVNTRQQGNYLVVQRLAPQFTLRNGTAITSVFNGNAIHNIRHNKG